MNVYPYVDFRGLKFLREATGLDISWEELNLVADRVFNMIRCFWIREYNGWNVSLDHPPLKWFISPLKKGSFAGEKLDKLRYEQMLQAYYQKRGWDHRGIPRKLTLKKLGLNNLINSIDPFANLSE